jgi:hypothetical protein
MEDIFDRTMNAGDEDEKRYRSAVKSYEDQDGSCRKVSGASARISEQLAKCAERRRRRNWCWPRPRRVWGTGSNISARCELAQGKIHNPQQKRLATWCAAPKNIDAYDEASKTFPPLAVSAYDPRTSPSARMRSRADRRPGSRALTGLRRRALRSQQGEFVGPGQSSAQRLGQPAYVVHGLSDRVCTLSCPAGAVSTIG